MSQQQNIIVVDDEAAARDMIGDYLKMHGFDVTLCDGGKSLRAEVEKARPDLVILDLNMPEEDGLSLVRFLKQSGNVPVIMLTATASPIDRVVGLELGADDYLAKPAELREVLARVRSVLRRSAAAAGRSGGHAEPHGEDGHEVARPRCPRAARRGGERASADGIRVRPAQGVRREPEAGADPRASARPRAGARRGGLRPRDRRAHHAHPPKDRAGPRAPADHQDGPRRGLCVLLSPDAALRSAAGEAAAVSAGHAVISTRGRRRSPAAMAGPAANVGF